MSTSAVSTVVYEKKIQCPYEKSHQILPERMQFHLVKCRQSHPDEKKAICSFNTTHIVGECEFQYHLEVCPDKKSLINHVLVYDNEKIFDPVPVENYEIDCGENWDDCNVPTYDPSEHLEKSNVVVPPRGMKPSQRRLFSDQQRRRHAQLQEQSRSVASGRNSNLSQDSVQMRAPRRPISVADIKKDLASASTSRIQSSVATNGIIHETTSTGETSESSMTSYTSNNLTSDTESTLIHQFDDLSLSSSSSGAPEQWITAKRKSKPTRGRGRSTPSD